MGMSKPANRYGYLRRTQSMGIVNPRLLQHEQATWQEENRVKHVKHNHRILKRNGGIRWVDGQGYVRFISANLGGSLLDKAASLGTWVRK